MNLAELIAIAAVAAAAGTLGTLLGLGGGVILVPVLTVVFGVQLKTAVAASAIAVVANSSSGSGGYILRRFTNIRLALLMLIPTASGALLGGLLAVSLPSVVLKATFAALLFYVAWAMARRVHVSQLPPQREHAPDPLRLSGRYFDPALDRIINYTPRRLHLSLPVAATAGLASGLFGIGGGPIIVPLMNIVMGVPIKAAASTSSFMVGTTAAASATVYYTGGYVDPRVTIAAIIGIVGGAQLGIRIATRIRPAMLGRIFVVVLVGLGLSMLADAVGLL